MTETVHLRAIVLDILMESQSAFSHIVIRQALEKYQYLDKQQRAFISRLALGTIERRMEMDYIIGKFSRTPVEKIKPVIQMILEMSVYQLLYMESVPDSAVCNEAVKLTKKRGFSGLSGYVNGVLRNIARNKADIPYPDRLRQPLEYLSVKYSMPEWILQMWQGVYSIKQIEEILCGFQADHKTYIRCNTMKDTPENIRKILEKEGVMVEEVQDMPYAFSISGYDYLSGLQSFHDGLYQIQDISSMMAGEFLHSSASDFIVDVCAAPGGKSVNAALKMAEKKIEVTGRVLSRDVSESKVQLIEDNIERLGLSYVKAQVYDALCFDESLVEKADIVIADLPCSGLGVIGRKPDIKYRVTPQQMFEAVNLQRRILQTVSAYVKPGGVLLYSTCTINRAENEDNADWICRHSGFEADGKYLQILPGADGGRDGFFIARLIKLAKR